MKPFLDYCHDHLTEITEWQQRLCQCLDDVTTGKHKRFTAIAPQASGKTLFTQFYIRYHVTYTNKRILHASYSRSMCEFYQRHGAFDTVTYTHPRDSLTGQGNFDIAIIDGFETHSLTVQPETAYDWYRSNFAPRLKTNAPMIYVGASHDGFKALLHSEREWSQEKGLWIRRTKGKNNQ